ncbi:MAG TPA: MnmC family methyltransferase [Bdellovibrionales bacterium]|nr:MnmC family methyltransferase [Bdellovibrionales bacterium]
MFTFQETEDGSLTLRITQADGASEAMHSLRGAFSETVYIYGTAMQTALDQGLDLRVLSMGLGLGYVEILAAALWLKGGKPGRLQGESFEIVPELRDYFQAWLRSEACPTDFQKTYDDVLVRTAKETGVSADLIQSALNAAVDKSDWKIREALEANTMFTEKFTVICFDAFSSKSTPDLWSEEFLNSFFLKACAPSCVLSTYACTGALKRALRNQEFTLTIREGFSSKRDSTFAVRHAVSN